MSLKHLDRIKKALDFIEDVNGEIENDNKARDNRIAALEEKLEDLINVNAGLSAQIKAENVKFDDIQDIKIDLRKLEKKFEEIIDNQKAINLKPSMSGNDLNEDIMADNNDLLNQNEKDEKALDAQHSFGSQLVNMNKENSDLKKKIDLLEKKHKEEIELLKLNNDLQNPDSAANQAGGGDENLQKRITELEKKLEVQEKTEKISKTTIRNLKVLGNQFRDMNKTKDKELLENNKVMENLQREIIEVKEELEKTKKELKEACSLNPEELLKGEMDKGRLSKEKEEMSKKEENEKTKSLDLEELLKEKERLIKENEELIRKGMGKDDKIKTIMNSMKTKLMDVQKENNSLKASMAGDLCNNEILTLYDGLNKAKIDIAKLNLEKEKNKSVHESQLSTIRNENNALKTQLNLIQDEKEKLDQQIQSLKVKRTLPVEQDKDEESTGDKKKRKFEFVPLSPFTP